ncbi:MAG: xanthine dehydrogenase family protein subunit M [Burkholderiales bacterium]|nr:xanthine dehydrogenase family protein subunit M [Burkholderiales bacterium]
MYAFDYVRPQTLKEAAAALRKSDQARFLAGGQSLVQALRLRLARPPLLIDLRAIDELNGIRVANNVVSIGAMTRHADVAAAKEVQRAIPALARVAAGIGDRQVRNQGTLGGSLANADPAADYPAAVLGLGATIVTSKREIPADKFFLGLFETALKPGEIIVRVDFPQPLRAGYAKFRHPASRFALVGVFVCDTTSGVRVAVTGAGPCAFRVKRMEKVLAKAFTPQAIEKIVLPAEGLNSDIHAAADYRAHLVTVMAQRAVTAAAKL